MKSSPSTTVKRQLGTFIIFIPLSHVILTKVDNLTIDLTDGSIQPFCEHSQI